MENGQLALSTSVAAKAAELGGGTTADALVVDAVLAAKSALERGEIALPDLCRQIVRLDKHAKSTDDVETGNALRSGIRNLARLIGNRYSEAELRDALAESRRPGADANRDASGKGTVKALGDSPRDIRVRRESAAKSTRERDALGRSVNKVYG